MSELDHDYTDDLEQAGHLGEVNGSVLGKHPARVEQALNALFRFARSAKRCTHCRSLADHAIKEAAGYLNPRKEKK